MNEYLKWLSSTESIYWNDSVVSFELEDAISNGATGATSNPFLITDAYLSERRFWDQKISFQTTDAEKRAEQVTMEIVSHYAKKYKPMFCKEKHQGYFCVQTNISKCGDAQYMLEQAKRFSKLGENIAIKLPVTAAGLKAYEECVASGIPVVGTLSMTVPQVLAVGEAAARGKKRALENGITPALTVAVVMVGRLDNYIRDVAQDSGANVSESDIIQCGTACIKRAYQMFSERGYDTFLMPAGSFNAANITSLAGAKMIMSIAPRIAKMLETVDQFEENIDKPVAENVIERLMQIEEFRKAYEPDGLKPEEFITYGGNNRTIAQYLECGWNPLLKEVNK